MEGFYVKFLNDTANIILIFQNEDTQQNMKVEKNLSWADKLATQIIV